MTKKQLVARLIALVSNADTESAHGEADQLLIDYIDDPDVASAYEKIEKWYA